MLGFITFRSTKFSKTKNITDKKKKKKKNVGILQNLTEKQLILFL